jgi:DNA-binding beta-propeller fold protein YncE
VAGVGGCIGQAGKPIPLDEARFPMGMAVSADGARLAVVSSNFDFAFDSGAVLLADVNAFAGELNGPDDVVKNPWTSGVPIPTFGDRPVFSADGSHLLLTSRDQNLLHELVVDGDTISCEEDDVCDQAPHALALEGNDPFDVVIVSDGTVEGGDGVIRGFVTHQTARVGNFFTVNTAADDNTRLQLESEVVDFGDDVFGVRSVAHRPAREGRDARIFAVVERRLDGVALGASLVGFEVPSENRGDDVVFATLDLQVAAGARTARDLVIVSDGDDDALVAALQLPDAIARFGFDEASGAMQLTGLSDSCLTPISLATADLGVDAVGRRRQRVLVTCQNSQSVLMLDPGTLAVTDSSRFFGRSPYDVVVDAVAGRAYVSYFLDNSIGVFALSDGDTMVLDPVGRLGEPLPTPEDGRE